MRILFDQSAHDMRNKGNNALLETAMKRLNEFWPDATLEVITDAPGLLKMYYPNTSAIDPNTLGTIHSGFERYKRFLPNSIWWLLFELREEIHRKRYWKNKASSYTDHISSEKGEWLSHLTPPPESQIKMLRDAISQFDLFVASGGGYMTDTDKLMLWKVFDRLEAAIVKGVPTVMVGQGIGPIRDPELLARARDILVSVDMILYRNRRNGLPLLESLGIPDEKIVFTGDDAIEMTYNERLSDLGKGIGVSLRLTHYTQVASNNINTLRDSLQTIAKKHGAPLVSIPISGSYQESDITHINKMLDGYDRTITDWRKFETPLELIRRTGKCKVVITGTYHGAIFALGQGIPVIGVAKSDEYFYKLDELADEYKLGVQVLRLDDDRFSEQLETAFDITWKMADMIRPLLLEVAKKQIELGQIGYQRLRDLLI